MEANVLKGIGTAGKAVRKLVGSILLIKEGSIDKFLQDSSSQLKKNVVGMKKEVVYHFASLSNSGIHVFMEKMEDMIQIYNYTDQIGFDDKKIYLLSSNIEDERN